MMVTNLYNKKDKKPTLTIKDLKDSIEFFKIPDNWGIYFDIRSTPWNIVFAEDDSLKNSIKVQGDLIMDSTDYCVLMRQMEKLGLAERVVC